MTTQPDPITEYSIDELQKACDIVGDAIDENTDMDFAIRRAIACVAGGDPQTDDPGEMLLVILVDVTKHLKLLAAKPVVNETPHESRRRLLKAAEDAVTNRNDNDPNRARALLEIANAYTVGGDVR